MFIRVLCVAGLLALSGLPALAAAPIDDCDKFAAHPEDPDRMAAGLYMDDMVPGAAVAACEAAVAQYADEPRFHYELGRAYEKSDRKDDAIAQYRAAGALGYRMADYSIGLWYESTDLDQAIAYLKKAEANGVKGATRELGYIVFTSDGYSNPDFFQSMYDGKVSNIGDTGETAMYLTEFLGPIQRAEGCDAYVSTLTMSELTQADQGAVFGQMLKSMQQAQSNGTGNLDDAATEGYAAGKQLTRSFAMRSDQAFDDAQLFFDRHGCASPVAQRFFKNIGSWAAGL